MPIVFVHGVDTRMSAKYQTEQDQRDALFKGLLAKNSQTPVINAYWGQYAAAFAHDLACVPDYDVAYETYGVASAPSGGDLDDAILARTAQNSFAEAIDLVFAGELAHRQEQGIPVDAQLLWAAETAARYAQANPKPAWLRPAMSNDAFVSTLLVALGPQPGEVATEHFGPVDWIRNGIRRVAGAAAAAASEGVLSLARDGLNRKLATFIGDVLVYLAQPTQGASPRARIRDEVIGALARGFQAKTPTDQALIVVGHSMGGVILYDLLTDPAAHQALEQQAPGFKIDALITVGSQVGLFEELGLYVSSRRVSPAPGKVKPPFEGVVGAWLNVFDKVDALSFVAGTIFDDVEDFFFSSQSGLLAAHTAYFKRPRFFERSRRRLVERKILS